MDYLRELPLACNGNARWEWKAALRVLASFLRRWAWTGVLLSVLSPAALAQTSLPAANASSQAALVRLAALQKQVEQLQGEIQALRKQLQAESEHPAPPAASPQVSPSAAEAPVAPAGSTGDERGVLGSIDLSGFVDAYYGYNLNHPYNRLSPMRAFDAPDNQFALNLMEVSLNKTPSPANGRLGFRFSLGFGNAMNVVNGADPGGLAFAQYLHEGYLSYLAPIGKGLQLDVGKFANTFGTEVIDTKDDWNYSRGLLFTYALPAYHYGLRAAYTFNDRYSLTGYLVNGWNDVIDNNTGKTVGFSFAWTPSKKFGVTQNYLRGSEQLDTNRGDRQLSDTVFSYAATRRFSLGWQYDYGHGNPLSDYGRPVDWTGAGAFLRYAFNEQYALAARYEYYDDADGFTTGTAQHVNEVTTTFERRVARDLIVRLEFRRDVSNQPSFLKGDLPVTAQNTLTGGLVYVFDARENH